MKAPRFLKFAGFAALGTGFVILAVFIIMSLWNALIPSLFHGPVLTFWQTAGLFILSKILLTGVAPRCHDKRSGDWRSGSRREYFKSRFSKEYRPGTEDASGEQAQ